MVGDELGGHHGAVSRRRPNPLPLALLLCACTASTPGSGGVDDGDADEIPWARDPDALALTDIGEAAAGLCSEAEERAVLDSARVAMARYQVLDLYMALQWNMISGLEGLVEESLSAGGQPDCLSVETGDTLVISSEETCELHGGITWTGTLVRDQGSSLTTLSYDQLTVTLADEVLTVDGRADELWGDSGFHWETNLRWSLPEDIWGVFGVAGSSFAGLTGSSWSAWSTDPLFDEAGVTGEQFLAWSRLEETPSAEAWGLPPGIACGAASSGGNELAVQGDVLWELAWNAEEGCYDTWRDGESAGLFCWAETSYPAGPPRP